MYSFAFAFITGWPKKWMCFLRLCNFIFMCHTIFVVTETLLRSVYIYRSYCRSKNGYLPFFGPPCMSSVGDNKIWHFHWNLWSPLQECCFIAQLVSYFLIFYVGLFMLILCYLFSIMLFCLHWQRVVERVQFKVG